MSGHEIFSICEGSYDYSGKTAIDYIDLKIMSGESLAVLGANGCGKTTLLKVLSGLLVLKSGEFSAFGEHITAKMLDNDRLSALYHRRVGFIFQNSDAQLFCSTVRDEIAFGPLQTGMGSKEVKKRVGDVAEMLNITTLLDCAPFHLSGGEKKKAALAAVLVLNPEVLLLDEPTNELDPRSQRWLINLLLALKESGKTIVISTHNLKLASEISQRAILFDETHHIAADGKTTELLSNIGLLRSVNLVDDMYSV